MSSPFEYAVAHNIFKKLQPHINSGNIIRNRETGQLSLSSSLTSGTPWRFIRHHPDTKCWLWNNIMFAIFKQEMGNPASGCQTCYKVCVRPRSLNELFIVESFQVKMQEDEEVACKCGMELREHVHGLWGAYFYTRSLEEGKKRYKQVRRLVDIHLSNDVPVYLKRGCTDMEDYYGDSDKQQITETSLHWENLISDAFDHTFIKKVQTEGEIHDLHQRWVEYAYAYGDPTYKLFTNGKRLFPKYVTYHDKKEMNNG